MKMLRRTVLAGALPFGALAQPAWTPDRPLRLVVPYAPGGVTDQLGRAIAERMGAALGQAVIVENRPGANTIIGSDAVAKSAPDGHTLLMASGASMVLNPLLYRRLPYDAGRDLGVLAVMVETPLVMVVGPRVPARSIAEFVAWARENPTAVNYASVGLGNPIQLAAEMFRMAAGIEMQHIAYPGSAPALTALLAGDVQVMFDVVLTALPFIRDGRLRALGVTTRERIAVLPDVPTIAETFSGYEATTWFGVAAPRGIPAPVAQKLGAALADVQRDEAFRGRFAALGLTMLAPRDPTAIAALLVAERARWQAVIAARGIVLD